MSITHRLRTILVCAVLEWSALIGAPMRPEEIVDLMQTMNTPRVTHTNPDDDDQGAPAAEGEGLADFTIQSPLSYAMPQGR